MLGCLPSSRSRSAGSASGPLPLPLPSLSSDLIQRHSQLQALAETCEVLLQGLEASADVEGDFLHVFRKLREVQQLLDAANEEAMLLR